MPKEKGKNVVLIDGNSLAYRAFYALPDTMKTSTGITTNAVYGFTTMLLKLLETEPDFLAIAFDLKEPTFRHKEYKEYKATRDKAPPTLNEQMPYVKEVAQSLDIPIYEVAGYEADDIIGTLAKESEAQGYNVEIVSGDLDPLQLVTPKIKVLTTRRGISDTVIYDEKAVKERYGLSPDQLIDFKALKGDSSDNIPGVKGIGEKTAAELIKKFKTLDNLLSHIDDIEKTKLKENLKNGKNKALLSKKLVTIVTNVPLELDFKKLKRSETDWSKVLDIFQKMEFDSLVKKYQNRTEGPSLIEKKREKISEFDFRSITSEKDLDTLIKELEKNSFFSFDCETTSINTFEAKLVGISFSTSPEHASYIPLGHKEGKQLDLKTVMTKLKPFLESDKTKYGHNIKYDIEVLIKYGLRVAPPYFDTMVAAYLLDPVSGGYNLKKVGARYLGRHEMIKFTELEAEIFSDIKIDLATEYACSDADVTLMLGEVFEKKLKDKNLWKLFKDIEMPLIEVLVELEENGVYVDTKELNKLSAGMDKQMQELERHIFSIAGEEFNLNSPKQLSVILFDKLKLPVIKKGKTGPSTNAEVLEELSEKFEIAQKLLEYRSYSKLKSTYVDVLPELINKKTGRIHASFNQTITATGRLSSSDPNMQNIPIRSELGKKIREAFVPQKKGWVILAADYSQIELRILAHLSRDPVLLKAFKEGKDVHQATADELGISRDAAKTVNFGIIYGISDFGLAKSLKIKRTEAAEFIKKYFEKHTGVKEFIDKTIKEARETGEVCTMLKRIRPLPDINSPNHGLRSFTERTAINTPVQGSAADMIKVAMVRIRDICGESRSPKLILQVHDELVFEVLEEEVEKVKKIIQREMEQALKLDIPVKVDIEVGKSWGEAK